MQFSRVSRWVPGRVAGRSAWIASLAIKEGDKVPYDVVFKTRVDRQWVDLPAEKVFKGKKVVLFGLPGAFTPTCSSTHLPRYSELIPDLKKAGVDQVACITVNDAFVCNAWLKDQGIDNVAILPDGNGEFSEAIGALCDKSHLGFGKRSWRYSMFVNDGRVEKIFSEPDKDGDPFEVSDADTMLKYLTSKK